MVYFPRSGSKAVSSQRRRIRKICVVMLQVAAVCLVKITGNAFGIERISLNPLFSALVASTVFLLGFLLNGVLTDFKESEKIPAEIATALQSLYLEIQAITAYHPEAVVGGALTGVARLGQDVLGWLGEALSFEELLVSYRYAHGEVVGAAVQFKGDASTLRGRLMQDMAVVLQKINRIQTIRATKFVPLVYWMADIASFLLFAGLVLAKTENISESVFFLAVISFLLLLLLRLIDDIDNPFGQTDNTSAENVSIDLLEDAVARLRGCGRAY
ncbi:MAG: hypothetical protein WCQ20_02055 [Synechococcaceae cyanobacterium ELA739]